MINQPIILFKIMYLMLAKEWERDKEERFGLFLSEADPFITGNDSADPIVFSDFIKAFEAYGSYQNNGYDFILKYLSELDPFYGDIKKYFDRIDMQQYIVESEKYATLSDEELVSLLDL